MSSTDEGGGKRSLIYSLCQCALRSTVQVARAVTLERNWPEPARTSIHRAQSALKSDSSGAEQCPPCGVRNFGYCAEGVQVQYKLR